MFRKIILFLKLFTLFRKKKASILIENDEVRISYIFSQPQPIFLDSKKASEDPEMLDLVLESYVLLTEKNSNLHFKKHKKYLEFFKVYFFENNNEIEMKKIEVDSVDYEYAEDLIERSLVKVVNNEHDIHYLYQINTELSITKDQTGQFLIKYIDSNNSVIFEKILNSGVLL